MQIATNQIPRPKGKTEIKNAEGLTKDIIKEILEADKEFSSPQFCNFAQQFSQQNWKVKNQKQGLYNLWYFTRHRIRYKQDPKGWQIVQEPPALWKRNIGDCKSKTLFITAVLRCLDIPYIIRFANYPNPFNNPDVTHVYPVAFLDGEPLIIDAVWHKFGEEAPYNYKQDFKRGGAAISGPRHPWSPVLCKYKNALYSIHKKY